MEHVKKSIKALKEKNPDKYLFSEDANTPAKKENPHRKIAFISKGNNKYYCGKRDLGF